ncbi:PREDICTED: 5-oxoprolinase-like [Priapulus caudatus]|uniref:5-oxoprolinase-like n=1 Tax=Priapulus caudatus TaxID=37621 RepID=A0ABM1E873_PRICU|nr:PREDICTED: 5-oxoprolinase-like [Priapulus caudatus]
MAPVVLISKGKFKFAIDRGGTFTDVYAECPQGRVVVTKLLSEDPTNYPDAPREGIRRILESETGVEMPADKPLDCGLIDWIRMGTTVATNALLERKGERLALAITAGFKDALHIGNQSRPDIFDLEVKCPDVLHEDVIEVEERVVMQQDKCQIKKNCPVVIGSTKEKLEVWKEIDEEKLRRDLQTLLDKGIRSVAVSLMHAYTYGGHERVVGKIASEMGFTQVSLSSDVMPMVRLVPRGYTACADGYLTPHIKTYIKNFTSGFKGGIDKMKVLFMQSDGGLAPANKFLGSRAILSGPAGGVVGYAMTTYSQKTKLPVIGFDMGGTSTDVSRYAGSYEHVFETTTAGVTIQAPQLDINTVAAGGGSKLFYRAGMFVVGPESAGAHPGPTCYRKGGPLCVTDANLCLGRLLLEYFPKIFGKTEDQPLDMEATQAAFSDLTAEVNKASKEQKGDGYVPKSLEEVAIGFIEVANETMCRPIRALTQSKGYDTSRHVLACFGGAGGQHACSIARSLGMKTVFIHRYCGILSAYGMALADVVHEAQEPCALEYSPENFKYLDERMVNLSNQCIAELQKQGFNRENIETETFLHLRYNKTDCALMCSAVGFPASANSCSHGNFLAAFLDRYNTEFGFTISDRTVLVDDIRVRGIGKSGIAIEQSIAPADSTPAKIKAVKVYFKGGYQMTDVYMLEHLKGGHKLQGPAVIIDKNSTILLEPDCEAEITRNGDVRITIGTGAHSKIGTELDDIQLSIFSHRFMSTAEQMGRILQRTAISTNIKERLDFSCAMFGPDGGLVANAPHIPVHLGAMQETVQFQLRQLGDSLRKGDVILSNHPCAGGSHLPDLTVITPVFYKDVVRPVFFVASRGHHADIGGITPGSMPPHSKSLDEEGAVFRSFKLVVDGVFQEKAVTDALMEPEKFPGSSGTRNLQDNLSDLRAQVAANQKGIRLITELIDIYGLDVVQAYMAHIQANAELAVREMLREIAHKTKERTGTTSLYAEDFMDDGTKIAISIDIDEEKGSAIMDFSGTGYEVYGNCNAPRAVTLSALIYCLRCMVGHDVPLNQGCLAPIKTVIPAGTILTPSDTAAVVGGNVLTSQRIVDVILKAFGVCAASQGCMNNITFGDKDVGYYETVAGGAGAGPGWHGRSGVHTHCTNTRITDPEIVERRYPVIVQRFELNPHSGGVGRWHGGDGVIRELLFRKDLMLSVLTERRVFSPYGLNGGRNGQRGLNLLLREDGRIINLGGKTAVNVLPGDVFRLRTPAGGGYGAADDEGESRLYQQGKDVAAFALKGSVHEYTRRQESA